MNLIDRYVHQVGKRLPQKTTHRRGNRTPLVAVGHG